MEITVFGANGPTGRCVVRQALDAGHGVTAVTRRPDDYPMAASHLTVVSADVTHSAEVDRAVAGSEAVISTYGVPYSRRSITVYSVGLRNIVAAMQEQGIPRLVCVSSTSVSTEEAPGETLFWRRALIPFLRHVVGRTLYDDMQRMEDLVRASGLDWTIVRPGGLFNTIDPTEDYEVSTDRLAGRMTSRADLAEALLREVAAEGHPKAIIEVITRSQLPGPRTFFKDAFGGA